MRAGILIPCLLALGMAACQNQRQDLTDVVATVDGVPITRDAFEKTLNKNTLLPGRNYSTNERKRGFLQEVIRQELLFQRAMEEGFVEKSERLRKTVAREYLADRVARDGYQPTDEEIRTRFENQRTELEQVRASHILLKFSKPDESKEAKALLRTKLEGIRREYLKDPTPENFARLARTHSEDAANRNEGGDLGFFDRNQMVKPFADAAFALKKIGEVSDVVETNYGYHIVQLTGERRGLEGLHDFVKQLLLQEHQKKVADGILADLEKNASVRIDDEVLAKVTVTRQPLKTEP